MTLKEKIIADMIQAMKSKSDSLSTLRMIKAEIMKYEVSGADKVANDDIVIGILKRAVKQGKEASEGFEKGGNLEAAQKERDEIKILKKYLPEQMSEEAIQSIIQSTIETMNADKKDFGKVMGAVIAKCKGQADGNIVSRLLKKALN